MKDYEEKNGPEKKSWEEDQSWPKGPYPSLPEGLSWPDQITLDLSEWAHNHYCRCVLVARETTWLEDLPYALSQHFGDTNPRTLEFTPDMDV